MEGEERVILPYLKSFIEEINILEEGGKYKLNGIKFATPIKQHHPGDVFGFVFNTGKLKVSYIVDTKYFPELANIYKADIMIFNVIRLKPTELEHLSIDDVKDTIVKAKPKTAILTHFGMTVLRAKPWELAESMTHETGIQVIAAKDGMKFELPEI